MKYASYIFLFVIAAIVAFLAFRQFRGPGDLAEDFNIVTESVSQEDSSPANSTSSEGLGEVNPGLARDFDLDSPDEIETPVSNNSPDNEIIIVEDNAEIMITDGVRHIVPLDKILSGGPPKDGIPSIDEPKFVSVAAADEYLDDNKLGIAVEKNGNWRFYPFQILVWHEIVNDVFEGEHILVTYCPLCQTGIVFEPIVEDEGVEFGTSGRLFNSNLVMYDRKTDTLWSQQGGRAIVGKLAGQRLTIRAADNVFWGEFKAARPEAQVLSQDTGFFRDYTRDPYGNYYTNRDVYFPLENRDTRLHEKAITYGLEVKDQTRLRQGFGGQAKAYAEEAIKRDKLVNDTFAGINLVIVIESETQAVRFFNRTISHPSSSSSDGMRTLTFELRNGELFDQETGSRWSFDGQGLSGPFVGVQLNRINPEFGFWFAWAAFNPETELYN